MLTALQRWWEEILDFEIYYKENILTSTSATASFIEKLWVLTSFRSSVFKEVMQVVINVVNFVKSTDLNCRLCKDFCSSENAEYSSLLLYTAVRWLSRGSTLKRIFTLRGEVKDFLHNRKNKNATFLQMNCSLLALSSWLTFLKTWMSWIFHCKVEANGCLNCKLPFVFLLTSWLFSAREQKLTILVCVPH